ncbi:MAG: MaoC family dehydratase [Betaproteobacteria bacterium]|nr:MaoC family dehydratase [Betaproteobacteria bacterium]
MIFQRATDVGWELPPVSRQMTLRQFEERHPMLYGESTWPHKNIHSDAEAARAEGLPEPVGSAPTFFALVTRAMMTCFGDGWIIGGRSSLKMIKPVYAHNFVTAKGILKEKQAEGASVRYVFDVWVENEAREKVVVGSASALVPASIESR